MKKLNALSKIKKTDRKIIGRTEHDAKKGKNDV